MKRIFSQLYRRLVPALVSVAFLSLSLSSANAQIPSVTYRVIIITSNNEYAGTAAPVSITLYGQNGDSGALTPSNQTDIARATAASFVFSLFSDLGEITGVGLRLGNGGDGWLPERVIVSNEVTGKKWLATCEASGRSEDDCWLHVGESYTLTAIPFPREQQAERPFNLNSFKMTHNAYEQSGQAFGANSKGSYATQIDDYDSWGIELDLYWEYGQFEVAHDGCEGTGMNLHLAQIAESITWQQKVIVLWLEIKEEGEWGHTDCPLPPPATYEMYIQAVVNEAFTTDDGRSGWSHVYTVDEFKNQDHGRWPSWQALVRRGRNIIIVVQRPGDPNRHCRPDKPCTGYPVKDWFFEVMADDQVPVDTPGPGSPENGSDQEKYEWENNLVFANMSNYRNLPLHPDVQGAYWGTRMYPDSYCEGGPVNRLSETMEEWEIHVGTHATLVATNCVDRHWTNGTSMTSRQVHPPQPTYVVPANTIDWQYGTLNHPYRGTGNESFRPALGIYQYGLLAAIQRVGDYGSSTVMWIAAGDYDLNPYGYSGIVISDPMVLKATNGIVVIH